MENRPIIATSSVEQAAEVIKEFEKAFAVKQEMSQEFEVKNSSKLIKDLGTGIWRIKKEQELQTHLIKIGEAEVKDAEKRLRAAQRKLRSCKKSLQELQNEDEQLIQKFHQLKEKLNNVQKLQRQFSSTVLIHSSANTLQVVTNIYGKIVTTKRDSALLKEAGLVIDETFSSAQRENLITYIPEGIKDKYDPLPWKSVIDFCEMAAYYKISAKPAEEEKVVLLYSNWDIAKILKANGLSAH